MPTRALFASILCLFVGCAQQLSSVGDADSSSGDAASSGSTSDAGAPPDLAAVDLADPSGDKLGAACFVFYQTCVPGAKCVPTADGAEVASGICVPNGSIGRDQPCDSSGFPALDDCESGLWCIPGLASACRRICYDDSSCPSGQACAMEWSNWGACIPSCEPFSSAPLCAVGDCSQLEEPLKRSDKPFWSCRTPGSGGAGDACQSDDDCGALLSCNPDVSKCMPFCDSDHPCPSPPGLWCGSTGTADGVGICGAP